MVLQRKTPLKPGKPLTRKTPLRQVSAKRAALLPRTRRPKDTGPDRATREVVLDRDQGCVGCGAGPYGLQLHHRKPRRLGGRTGRDINLVVNLVALCRDCHSTVESQRAWALDLGLLLHEGEDPELIPVLHHQYGVVLLGIDGNVIPLPGGAA
jgi:5-methylcytosine-specific restriction enzyme A